MNTRRKESAERKMHSRRLERRSVITGAGKALTLGAIAAAFGATLPPGAKAQDAKAGKCVTVLYKNADGIKFDFEYYKKNHLTMIMELYGKAIRKFELRKGMTAQDGTKPTYVAVVSIWIGDQAAFDAAGAKYSAKLVADVPNFTNTQAVVQNDEVYAEAVS